MSVSVNHHIPQAQPQVQPTPQYAPLQTPGMPNPLKPGLNQLVQQGLAGLLASVPKGRAEAAGTTQITGMAVFDDLAGVKQEDSTKTKQKKTLRERKQSVQQRSRNTQRKVITRTNLLQEDEEEPIKEAASKTLAALRGRGRQDTEEELAREYDPLQRYALLHNALVELEDKDMPATEKEELKEQLNGMLSDLVAKHRDEIRRGLKDQADVAAAAQVMAGSTRNLRELRFLYGAKGTGVFDSPLSPLAMAKALRERFGGDNFIKGMSSLRGRMASEFHVEPEKGMNPRLWLCYSDAMAFLTVQSTYAIAGELRRDLVEKAAVMPQTDDAEVTESLLGVVDAGKSKINGLVSRICNLKDADSVQKGRVLEQILVAVRKLPHTFWAAEKLPQRLEVLDDLLKQVGVAYQGMPTLETGVERHERQWRESWEARKQQVADSGSAELPKTSERPKSAERAEPVELAKPAEIAKSAELPKSAVRPKPGMLPKPGMHPKPGMLPKPGMVPMSAVLPHPDELPKASDLTQSAGGA